MIEGRDGIGMSIIHVSSTRTTSIRSAFDTRGIRIASGSVEIAIITGAGLLSIGTIIDGIPKNRILAVCGNTRSMGNRCSREGTPTGRRRNGGTRFS